MPEAEGTHWAPYGDEPPWEWLSRIAQQAWRRLVGPPPEWTEADTVPEGAEPICPRCVLPHHPLAAVCPHCGEIVSRWAPWMAYVWILVWGRGLWRTLARARLSMLLCVGLVFAGLDYLSQAAWMWLGAADLIRHRRNYWFLDWFLLHVWYVPVYLLVAIRMWEKSARAWGSWRLTDDERAAPTHPL